LVRSGAAGSAEADALAREASALGWLHGHVHAGRSYPLIAVRVCRGGTGGGPMIRAFETEDRYILDSTAYAIAVARRFDALGVLMTVLEVDTTLPAYESAMSLRLSVAGVVPPDLEAEQLIAEARQVLTHDAGTRAWGFVDPREVAIDVVLDHATVAAGNRDAVGSAAVSAAAVGDLAHTPSGAAAEVPVESAVVAAAAGREGGADTDSRQTVEAADTRATAALTVSAGPAGAGPAVRAAWAGLLAACARGLHGVGGLAAEVGAAVAGLRVLAQPPRLDGRRRVVLGALLGVIVVAAVLMQAVHELPGLVGNAPAAPGAAQSAASRPEPSLQPTPRAVAAAPTAAPVIAAAPAAAPVVAAAPTAAPVVAAAPTVAPVIAVAPTAAPVEAAAPAAAPVIAAAPTAAPVVAAAPTAAAVVAAATPAQPPPLLDFGPQRQAGLSWPNDPQSVGWFAPDGYHLAARKAGQFVAIGLLQNPDLRNVLVTATFHKLGGPAGGGYGIILRDQPQGPRDGLNQQGNFLVFEVGDKGEVGIWRRDQGQWVDILGWTPSPAVKTGSGENSLSVRAVGEQLEFSVNGTQMPTQTSAQPASGGVGVFLGGDANEALLTQLTVTPAS
jgi:hypothetical protein